MVCYVTSIGEATTDLCIWSLQRNGFKVIIINSQTSLWTKLDQIISEAQGDFLRVDADIVANRNLTPELLNRLSTDKSIWWWQFRTWDWFKQDLNHSISFIRQEALPALRANVQRFRDDLRPETSLSRLNEFYAPRRFKTYEERIMGIHGFGTKDLKPVIKLKASRGQSHLYDFELAMRLNELA